MRPALATALVLALFCLVGEVVAQERTIPRLRGMVTARNEAMLSTQINAIIAEMPFRAGDRFRKGDTLVRFDCSVQKAQYQRAQAEVSAARKTLTIRQELLRLSTVSPLDVQLAEAEVAKAEADLAQANAINAMCLVRAPYDGRVLEAKAHAHESYTSGQPLLAILDDSSLEVEVLVPSSWLTWMKAGTGFRLKIEENGQTVTGTVSKLGARIDQVSQTIKVYGSFGTKAGALIPGMTGEVAFDGQP